MCMCIPVYVRMCIYVHVYMCACVYVYACTDMYILKGWFVSLEFFATFGSCWSSVGEDLWQLQCQLEQKLQADQFSKVWGCLNDGLNEEGRPSPGCGWGPPTGCRPDGIKEKEEEGSPVLLPRSSHLCHPVWTSVSGLPAHTQVCVRSVTLANPNWCFYCLKVRGEPVKTTHMY